MTVEHCFASYLTCDTLVTLPPAYMERLLLALAPKIFSGEKRAGDSDNREAQETRNDSKSKQIDPL